MIPKPRKALKSPTKEEWAQLRINQQEALHDVEVMTGMTHCWVLTRDNDFKYGVTTDYGTQVGTLFPANFFQGHDLFGRRHHDHSQPVDDCVKELMKDFKDSIHKIRAWDQQEQYYEKEDGTQGAIMFPFYFDVLGDIEDSLDTLYDYCVNNHGLCEFEIKCGKTWRALT